MCNLRAFRGKFGNTCEAAASFIRWEGMGTPSVPIIILSKIIINSVYDQWSFLKTLLILVFLVQCFNDAGEQSCGGDVLESEKNPYQDRWKFSGWLMLFVPEAWVLRLWWATAWHSHFSRFTWKCKLWTKSTANSANPSAQEVEGEITGSSEKGSEDDAGGHLESII